MCRRLSRFCPQESELVCRILDFLFHAHAGGVPAGNAVVQKNWPPAGRIRLQQRRHLARVQRIHPRVAGAGKNSTAG